MALIVESLLQHPTIRHFLLGFEESSWPSALESAAVLGIHAMTAKYGSGARLADARCLSALTRWVEHQGVWPVTIGEVKAELRETSRRKSSSSQRPKRRSATSAQRNGSGGGGRSLPPSRIVRQASRLAAAPYTLRQAVMQRRGRSAPPLLDSGDAAPRIAHRRDVDSRREEDRGSPPPWRSADGVSLSAPRPRESRKESVDLDPAPAAVDPSASEWYQRLMSRLKRLETQRIKGFGQSLRSSRSMLPLEADQSEYFEELRGASLSQQLGCEAVTANEGGGANNEPLVAFMETEQEREPLPPPTPFTGLLSELPDRKNRRERLLGRSSDTWRSDMTGD